MLKRLSILVLSLVAAVPLYAQDEAALKQHIQARAEAIADLLGSGMARETSTGLLEPSASLEPGQSATIQDENKDRQAVFALIAAKSGVPVEEVVKMYAARARKAAPAPVQTGQGPCKLAPAKAPDVARLLQYLKQGMMYASQKKFDMSLREFQAALAIDKNFLGLNQNVGSALLALKSYPEAEAAFKAELKLADCLGPLNDSQLSSFAYFMEVDETDPVKRKKAQTEKLKAQLPVIKGNAHYNLACLYALQKQKDPALASLRAAVDAGFTDKKALSGDPDLAYVRGLPDFREIAAKVQ